MNIYKYLRVRVGALVCLFAAFFFLGTSIDHLVYQGFDWAFIGLSLVTILFEFVGANFFPNDPE